MQPVILLVITILTPAFAEKHSSPLSVGDTWGPIDSKHFELLDDNVHIQYRDSEKKVVMVNWIQGAKRFQSKDDMLAYIESRLNDDSAIIQVQPEKIEQLQGKNLEVLSVKPLKSGDVQMICHSHLADPALCHDVDDNDPYYIYTVVRDYETGDTFPVVVSKHEGGLLLKDLAAGNLNAAAVMHLDEIAVIDKKVLQ